MWTPHPAQPPAPAAGFAELPQVCCHCGCAALQELRCLCLQSGSLMESVSLGSGRSLGVRGKCRPRLVPGVTRGSPGSTGTIQVLSCLVIFEYLSTRSSIGGNCLPQWGR